MGSHTRNVLTVKSIAASKAKKLRDGGGLWLIAKGQGRYWIFDYRYGGKRREMGIGPLHTVGLAEARQKAEAARVLVRQGIDPIEHRAVEAIEAGRLAANVKTFGQYADSYVDAAVKAGRWRGAKTEARWRNMLSNHAAPIRGKALADIGVAEVLSVLRPLWGEKQETAEKLRESIERVLDAAKVERLRGGENPAAWRGNLEHVLHRPDPLTGTDNQPSLPWRELPAFMSELRAVDSIAARALEFAILTAVRCGEVRKAMWGQIDIGNSMWSVPAPNTKSGRINRVPLSDAAVALLKALPRFDGNDHVFPGAKEKSPLSEMTLGKVIKTMHAAQLKADRKGWLDPDQFDTDNKPRRVVPHGFRSTFRVWGGDATEYARELLELALSHAVGDATERAYARGDGLEKRRALMVDWAVFCGKVPH